MECEICMEAYDSADRRPKMFPCGHSACLACVQGFAEKRCPECRLEFTRTAKDLPDNFALIRAAESSSRRSGLWCSDCNAVAQRDCFEDHNLKSAKAALQGEVLQLQVRAALVAEDLPEALRVDDDGVRVQALRVLQLARQPGTTLEVSVRGQGGEQALAATWTNPPATPASQKGGSTEDVEAVVTNVLVLALAKKGLWQQRGEQGRDGARRGGLDEAQENEATPDLPVLESMDVQGFYPEDLEEALQRLRQHRVRRLSCVLCSMNPAWSLQLLQLAAPHVEELRVDDVHREHFQAVMVMPKLRRLRLHGHSTDQSYFPAELPPLPEHHVGLRWLSVSGLPRETTFSLIRRNAGTLEELEVFVGAAGGGEWPLGCDDLHAELGRCGLAGLRRLVLARPLYVHLKDPRCFDQLWAVRDALPGVQVQCDSCDQVELEF